MRLDDDLLLLNGGTMKRITDAYLEEKFCTVSFGPFDSNGRPVSLQQSSGLCDSDLPYFALLFKRRVGAIVLVIFYSDNGRSRHV